MPSTVAISRIAYSSNSSPGSGCIFNSRRLQFVLDAIFAQLRLIAQRIRQEQTRTRPPATVRHTHCGARSPRTPSTSMRRRIQRTDVDIGRHEVRRVAQALHRQRRRQRLHRFRVRRNQQITHLGIDTIGRVVIVLQTSRESDATRPAAARCDSRCNRYITCAVRPSGQDSSRRLIDKRYSMSKLELRRPLTRT